MQHYTRNTVEVMEWCAKCRTNTMHLVSGKRLGACKRCIARLEAMPKKAPPATQSNLF